MKTDRTAQPFKLQTRLSVLTVVLGIVLVANQVYFEDEPGAVGLFLVVVGISWFVITLVRIRNAAKAARVESVG